MKEDIARAIPPDVSGELDRLSSLALAAGQDFNDELTFILNYAQVSLEMIGAQHPACANLVELKRSAMRCAETAHCLLLLTGRARDVVRCATVKRGDAYPGNRDFLR